MGCDIRSNVMYQRRVGDPKSMRYVRFQIERNYELFALLGENQRRPEIKPVHKPRGFPEDSWLWFGEDYDNYEGHTPSWYTIEQCRKVVKRYDALKDRTYEIPEFKMALSVMEYLEKEERHPIFVFWFDG